MKSTALIFFFIWVPLAGQTQHSITRIEFTKSGRGYKELVAITKDSVILQIENARSANTSQKYSQKLTSKKWFQLTELTETVSFSGLSALKSPTMKRAFDGALHGSLVFTTTEGKTYTHGFDDEDPHPSLHKNNEVYSGDTRPGFKSFRFLVSVPKSNSKTPTRILHIKSIPY